MTTAAAVSSQENPDLEPPFFSLVVSGGHTHLVRVNDYGRFDIIGRTRDDAAFATLSIFGPPGYPSPIARATLSNASLYYPSPVYCTDNAAMIGVAAYYEYINGTRHGWDLNAVPNLKPRPQKDAPRRE